MVAAIKLTEFSHGAGCGCKISPKVLDTILATNLSLPSDDKLLVGNASRDDAAVYDLGDGNAVISTTDFFMPIVDDPFDFGRIAATNAISDIYAMGGTPLMAIAILGWPVDKIPADVAAKVIDGGRAACMEAGILLAGGHSIDAPEPIFGLAVTGRVAVSDLKRNDTAQAGDKLYLTKPLGIGILTTAEKQKKLRSEDATLARDTMCQMNSIGAILSKTDGVNAITDVTGFGLFGHLSEVCEGAGLSAEIDFEALPLLGPVPYYLEQGCFPGGTLRNFDSYGHKLGPLTETQKMVGCDPQTSGGLLLAVTPEKAALVEKILSDHQLPNQPIGSMTKDANPLISVT